MLDGLLSWLRADAERERETTPDSDFELGHSADVSPATPHQVIAADTDTHTDTDTHAHRREHAHTRTHRERAQRESGRETLTLKLNLKDTNQRERVLRQQAAWRNVRKT